MAYVYKFCTTPLMGSRLAQRCNDIDLTPVCTQIWYSTTQGHVSRGAREARVPNEQRLDLALFDNDIQEMKHLTLCKGGGANTRGNTVKFGKTTQILFNGRKLLAGTQIW